MDTYVFDGIAGERIMLYLESPDFDAYLFLATDDGHVLAEDDDSGGDLNALLYATLPYTGQYQVWVNAWAPGDTGLYYLKLEHAEPFDFDDAFAMLHMLRHPESLTFEDLLRIESMLDELSDQVWAIAVTQFSDEF